MDDLNAAGGLPIEETFLDSSYRNSLAEALHSSFVLEIFSDSLSCINYPEILQEIRDLGESGGFAAEIYFNKVTDDLLNFLRNSNVALHEYASQLGPQEYILINGAKAFVTCLREGKRTGDVVTNEKLVKDIIDNNNQKLQKVRTLKEIVHGPIHNRKILRNIDDEVIIELRRKQERIGQRISRSISEDFFASLEKDFNDQRNRLN